MNPINRWQKERKQIAKDWLAIYGDWEKREFYQLLAVVDPANGGLLDYPWQDADEDGFPASEFGASVSNARKRSEVWRRRAVVMAIGQGGRPGRTTTAHPRDRWAPVV
jgi:hypothetical protein